MSNLREATANRLCGCDCNTPSPPLPSHIMPMSIFEEMMYKVAYASGYAGSKIQFTEDLVDALNNAQHGGGLVIQKDSIKDFPSIGLENAIYIDSGKKEIYFWKDDGYYKLGMGSSNEDDGGDDDGSGDTNTPPGDIIYEGGIL